MNSNIELDYFVTSSDKNRNETEMRSGHVKFK